jgi:ComEC/Rec2-related protein
MKRRVIFLSLVLIFRFSLGWFESRKYEDQALIKITGNIDNIYRNNTECIMTVGRFWIDSRSNCTFSRGDNVQVIGTIKGRVIDRFIGRLWLDNAELVETTDVSLGGKFESGFSTFLKSFREKMMQVYRTRLSEPESGLVAGIILGNKKDIGSKMYEQMVRSGTIHIAVASGYNIMLVGGTVLSICFFLIKRKRASLVAVLMMILYAMVAGGEPPVIRAVIMAGVVFWAAVLGRGTVSWWVLLVTGWLMILLDPLILVSVSFQLSMAASVGLMIVEPAIQNILRKNHEKLSEILSGSGILSSISTMVMTTPIIWWNFARLSWIGVVSNILILPLVPILMIFGAGMQVLPWLFSIPTYVVAHWMVEVIRFFGV